MKGSSKNLLSWGSPSLLAADGTGATVVLVTRRYEVDPAPREDSGVLPGVDYPGPLTPAVGL